MMKDESKSQMICPECGSDKLWITAQVSVLNSAKGLSGDTGDPVWDKTDYCMCDGQPSGECGWDGTVREALDAYQAAIVKVKGPNCKS